MATERLRRDFAPAAATREAVQAVQPPTVQAQVTHGSRRGAPVLWRGLWPAVEHTLNPHRPEQLPRSGSFQESALSPAYVQLAAWRPIWRLHNKERARFAKPLTSANSPAGRGLRLQTCRVAIRGNMSCPRGGLPGGRRRPIPGKNAHAPEMQKLQRPAARRYACAGKRRPPTTETRHWSSPNQATGKSCSRGSRNRQDC